MARAFSIIIPTLNEAENLARCVARLSPLQGGGGEVIVSDGGSVDGTVALAASVADRVVEGPPGRAVQMNAAAAVADGRVLVFLHADTQIADPVALAAFCERVAGSNGWGFCNLRLSGRRPAFRVIEWFINRRSRLTSVATGDQVLVVASPLFEQVRRFPEIPLMEDVALSKRLRRCSAPLNPGLTVTTSSRRWESRGIVRTVVTMWWLRLLFFVGVSPRRLHRIYYSR